MHHTSFLKTAQVSSPYVSHPDQHIQSVVHDSAEDALTAVTLYRRYRDLRSRKQCAAAIKDLYEAGRKHNWQVPQNKVS